MIMRDDARGLACPCCGSSAIGEPGAYEICGICSWEDDPVQSEDPSYAGGANVESLNDARMRWALKMDAEKR